jgi:hypothetical protein
VIGNRPLELRNPQPPTRSDLVYWLSPWAIHARQSVRRTGSRRSGHPLAPRVFRHAGRQGMPPDGAEPSGLAAPVDDHRRAHLRIVAGVALGVLVNGGPDWRATSSPGCRICGLPLTERMIWPQALTYGVPTLALCRQGCCELLIVKEGANLPGVVIPGVSQEHADPAFACRADLDWLRIMDIRAITKHRDSGVPVVFPGDCSDCR